jgi:exoribonuclease II
VDTEQLEAWAQELASALSGSGTHVSLGGSERSSPAVDFLHHVYIHAGNVADEEKLLLSCLLYRIRELIGSQLYHEIQEPDCCTPLDDVYSLLLELGIIEEHENQPLARSGIIQNYSVSALNQIDTIIARTLSAADEYRVDSTAVFTVDDPWSKDLDDAFSVRFLADYVELGIHISNVAKAIPFDTPLEFEARHRGATVYCPDKTFHMFPTVLAEQYLSLLPNQANECVSLMCKCTLDGKLLSSEFKLMVIESQARLTYDEVDEVLRNKDHRFGREIAFLNVMANVCNQSRGGDPRNPDEQDYKLAYDRVSDEISCDSIPMANPSRQMVAELMVLFNKSVAEYCSENSVPIFYRTQEATQEHGSPADDQTDPDEPVVPKHNLPRQYAPSQWSLQPLAHKALGFDCYTRCSSPLRSYVDYLAQLQLVADLSEATILSEATLLAALPGLIEAQKRVRKIQRESRAYWWLAYLAQQGKEGSHVKAQHIKRDTKESLFRVHDTELVVSAQPSDEPIGSIVTLEVLAIHPLASLASVRVVSCGIKNQGSDASCQGAVQ